MHVRSLQSFGNVVGYGGLGFLKGVFKGFVEGVVGYLKGIKGKFGVF
jgi:hypothetical protein